MMWIYWLLCFLIGVIPAWLLYRKDRLRQIPIKFLPALLRFFAVFLTAALLLAPAFPKVSKSEERPLVVWLQDNSLSMNKTLGTDSSRLRRQSAELINQLEKKYDIRQFAFGSYLSSDSLFSFHQSTTNISDAIQSVREQMKNRNSGAIVLVSDGIFTAGTDPTFLNLPTDIPVYTVGVGDSTTPTNAQVKRIYANKSVRLNDHFEILADLEFFKLSGSIANVSLLQEGKVVESRKIRVAQSLHTVRFERIGRPKGMQHFSVKIDELEEESNTSDNQSEIFIEVVDNASKILLLAAAPHPDLAALEAALHGGGHFSTKLAIGKLPEDWQSYDLIIAHQVPSVSGLQLPTGSPAVWYILGAQTDLFTFSKTNPFITIAGEPTSNKALPYFSTEFSLFNLPKAFQSVLEKFPPLDVVTGSVTLKSPAQQLFLQQIGTVKTDYPMWMVAGGEHPGSVLTGTGIWRWRMHEYKYFKTQETFDELVRQTVHLLTLKTNKRPFRVFMSKYIIPDNENLEIFAELRNENKELINGPQASLIIRDSSNKEIKLDFEREANYYKASPGLLAPGSYTFEGRVRFNGRDYLEKGAFEIRGVPLEYLRAHADFKRLMQLSANTSGQFFSLPQMNLLENALENQKRLKTVIQTESRYISLIDQRWLFFIILLFISAEWLLRKYWNLHS